MKLRNTFFFLPAIILLWSANIEADFPFADEVSGELKNNGCYMESYGVVKYLNSEEGKKLIEKSYILANEKAKQRASDMKFVKFCFKEPTEGGNQLEYLFTSKSKNERYLYFFERGGGIKPPGRYGDRVETGSIGEDCIPIDTSKWKISLVQVWEKMLDVFKVKRIWDDKFSQVANLHAYTILEMINPNTLVWEVELFSTSWPSGTPVSAGFIMDASTGNIIKNQSVTQELLKKGDVLFKKGDYCNALRVYGKLRQYPGGISRDEVENRIVKCMENFTEPNRQGMFSLPMDTSITITSSFTIMDNCWKDPVYYESEERETYKVSCRIYYPLGYREKVTGNLPEYSTTVLEQRGIKEFDFATIVKVGVDGKIQSTGSRGMKHLGCVSTGYPEWDHQIEALLNENWKWRPLPVATQGIIYFQFRPLSQ